MRESRLLLMSFMCVCPYNSSKKFCRKVSSMCELSDSVCITVMVY